MQPTNNHSVFKSDTRIFSNNHKAFNFTERALKCQRTSAVELTVAVVINSFNTRAAILTWPGGTQARQADKFPPNVSTPFRGYTRVGFTYGACTTSFSNTWRERPIAVMRKWSDKTTFGICLLRSQDSQVRIAYMDIQSVSLYIY